MGKIITLLERIFGLSNLLTLLKVTILLLVIFTAPRWGLMGLNLIIVILDNFGLTITYGQAGPIWGFTSALIPILMIPVLFVDEESIGHEDYQIRQHTFLMLSAKISDSSFRKSRRQLEIPDYIFNSPGFTAHLVKIPITVAPIAFLYSFVPLTRFFSTGGIYLNTIEEIIILGGAVLGIPTGIILLCYYIQFMWKYRKWRTFWLLYWRLALACVSPHEDQMARLLIFIHAFNPKKDGTKNEFIMSRINAYLKDFGIADSQIPEGMQVSDALDRCILFSMIQSTKDVVEEIKNSPECTTLLLMYIKKIEPISSPWSDMNLEEIARSVALLQLGTRLYEKSPEALEDLIRLEQSKNSSAESLQIVHENQIAVRKTPSIVWPKGTRWILIAYSLATTIALLIGFALTDVLLLIYPPS